MTTLTPPVGPPSTNGKENPAFYPWIVNIYEYLKSNVTAGTVTSVGWTGGIVSVATPTTTPAFTIAGTSGGVPYFSSATTWASSAALTANQIVLGGGAGVAPAALGSLGTATTVLHGNAGGAPAWGAVTLTTDVTGILPVANGGTGTATAFTAGSVIFAGASGVYAQDNASLFWDDGNNRLGIGTATPQTVLHVKGVARLESGTSGYIAFSPPTTGAAETYTWPTGPGTNDYVLTTNGTATNPTLTWSKKYWTYTNSPANATYKEFNIIADIAPTTDVARIGQQNFGPINPSGFAELSVISRWGQQAIIGTSTTAGLSNAFQGTIPADARMSTSGAYLLTDHDSTQGGLNIGSYGAYIEARGSAGLTASLGVTWGLEISPQNLSGTASVPIPSNYYPGGRNVAGLLIQAAGSSSGTTYDSSAALVIGANAPNGAKGDGYAGKVSFNKGIIFLDYSIATLSSAMEAIAMSANHQLTWTALGGASPKGRLYSDGTTLTWASTGTAAISTTTVTATNLGGTLTTAAQGNITSLGTLTGLTVSGTASVGSTMTVLGQTFELGATPSGSASAFDFHSNTTYARDFDARLLAEATASNADGTAVLGIGCGGLKINGVTCVASFGPSAVTSITVRNGLITAIS